MTRKDFMTELAACDAEWKLTDTGRIRRADWGNNLQCPILEVYDNADNCVKGYPGGVLTKARLLGLSEQDVDLVVTAADMTTYDIRYRPITKRDAFDIREELLVATGLKELT